MTMAMPPTSQMICAALVMLGICVVVLIVLAAISEAGGVIAEREVLARFALAPRDVGWIAEATLVDACITELVRRRLVERVVGGVRASQHVRRAA